MTEPTATGGATPAKSGTNGKAIASLVFSILGAGIFSIIGLILGYRAKREIDESGGAQGGRGLALAGIIIGWVTLAGTILYAIVVIAAASGGNGST